MYKFIKSSSNKTNWLEGVKKEVCFIGRSNVGKSSLINALTGQNKLAITSNTPGRTQLVNFFQDAEGRTLVDLPGYGYAKVPKNLREKLVYMIEEYFVEREQNVKTFLLIDSKVGPTTEDLIMLETLQHLEKDFMIVLTKVDKVNQSQLHKTKEKMKEFYVDFLEVSSLKSKNIAKLRKIVNSYF